MRWSDYTRLFAFSLHKPDWWELKIALWKQQISCWWEKKRKYNQIIKSLTEKNQVVAPVFFQNENPNSESNILSTNSEKKDNPKIPT